LKQTASAAQCKQRDSTPAGVELRAPCDSVPLEYQWFITKL
jgi:hypothetical protein